MELHIIWSVAPQQISAALLTFGQEGGVRTAPTSKTTYIRVVVTLL